MPDQSDILGPVAGINADGAAQMIAQRIAAISPVPVSGATGTAYTPSNEAVDFQYAAVPAAHLITSHGLDMMPNAAYDQSLQGRDRERASSAGQIADIAANLNPERLGANASAGEGAPIIGPDMMVESGNGRTLGILSAYSQGLPSAAGYQSHLVQNASQFGLDPVTVGQMENPVLVRMRQTEMDAGQRASFAAQANMSSVGVLSDTERAQRDAGLLLASDALPLYQGSDGAGLNPGQNRDFLSAFAQLLPSSERGSFLQADGSVSAGGVRQAQNALLAAAYPDNSGLSRMLESTDGNTRNIGSGMLSAAGDMAALRQGSASGDLHPLDISGNVSDAASLLSRLREEGTPLANHLATSSLFGDDLPKVTQDIASFMDANKRSGKRIGQVLSSYAGAAQALGSPDQETLFGDAPPHPEELFASARASVEDRLGVLPSAGGQVVPEEIAAARAEEARQKAERARVQTETARARASRGSGGAGEGSWNAEAANARAAAQLFDDAPAPNPPSTLSASETFSSDLDVLPGQSAASAELARQKSLGLQPAFINPVANNPAAGISGGRGAVSSSALTPKQRGEFDSFEEAANTKADVLQDLREQYTSRGDFGLIGTPVFASDAQEALGSVGLAPPLEKPTPFEEAKSKFSGVTRDLNDLYASQGRFLDIGKTKEYGSDLRRLAHEAGVGPEPDDPGLSGAYRAASGRRQDVEDALKDAYTLRGDFGKVGKEDYQSDLNKSLIEAGLAPPKEEARRGLGGALDRFKEDIKSPFGPLQYGYAVSAIAEGGVHNYAANNSGNYLTPEEKETAAAGLLPGIGTLAGTVAGSVIPGLGSWAGSLVGGGIGTAAQGVIGANEERAQASRQIGDEFTAALGEATSKLRDFSSQAEATGAPLKELQQVLGTAGSVAPLGANAIAGAGAMTNALGEYAPANYASVARQLKDPLVFGLAAQMGQNGRLTQGGYQALGYKAAIEGDAEGLQQDDLAAQRSVLADNPAYQAAQQRLRAAENPLGIAADVLPLLGGNSAPLAARLGVGVQAYRQSQNLEENNPGDPTAKARAALFQQFGQIREDEGVNQALGGEAEAARAGIGLRGGSAADIAAGSAPVRVSYQAQEGDINKAIIALRSQLADPTVDHKALDPLLNAQIADQSKSLLDLQNKDAAMTREDYLAPIAERGSGFSLSVSQSAYSGQSALSRAGIYQSQEDFLTGYADNPGPLNPTERNQLRATVLDERRSFQQDVYGEEEAGFSLSITRGALSGRSADSLQGDYDRQASYLQNFAQSSTSLLSATERAGIEQSADQMQYTAGRNVFQEAMGQAGIRDVQGQGQIGIAQAYGSPTDVYHADIAQVGNEQNQVSIIDDRLKQTIPVAERIQISSQRQSIENDIAVAPERARVAAYDAEGGILGSEQSAGRALLSRSQSVLGAKAFTPEIFTEDQSEVNLYAGAEAGSPLGSSQRARFGAERAQAAARLQEDQDASYQFGDQATRVSEMRSEGRFERAMKNPFQDGDPNNSPFTAGREYEGVLKTDMGRAEAALARTPQDSPAYEKNAEAVEQYKDKIADLEERRRMGFEEMLPEMIAGSPGRGRLTGIALTPGQSAAFNSNPFINGSFGKPSTSVIADGENHPAMAGGQAGAFLAATAGHAAAAMGGDTGPAILAELKKLNNNVERSSTYNGRSIMSNGGTNGVSPYAANGGR